MGRPSKMTPERREAVLHALRIGLTMDESVDEIGVHRDTFMLWCAQNADFAHDVRAAKGLAYEAITEAVAAVDWERVRARLEVRFPDTFTHRSDAITTLRRRVERLTSRYRTAVA